MILHPAHNTCSSRAWEEVTCDRCNRTYKCTPEDDFYCDARTPDHVCEKCLIGDREIITIDPELN